MENEILQEKLTYVSPSIEMTEINFEQNILAGSGNVDDMPNELW